jgi:biopolymer transport protein ExbB/TolQ
MKFQQPAKPFDLRHWFPCSTAPVAIMQPGSHKSHGSIAARTASSATLQRLMQRSAAAELSVLENRLTFLATTASVAPFIGLFGTVWGVLTSFMGLSNADTATLKAVGPALPTRSSQRHLVC